MVIMARKTFSTTIDEELMQKFREKCKADGVTMNEMFEMFIMKYLDNKVLVVKKINFEDVNL